MTLEKTLRMNQLFGFYQSLLTAKQQDMLSLYYEEDYSLAEIAEDGQVSRQAVYDSIRRGGEALERYEEELGLARRRDRRLELLDDLSDVLASVQFSPQQGQQVSEIFQALRAMDDIL